MPREDVFFGGFGADGGSVAGAVFRGEDEDGVGVVVVEAGEVLMVECEGGSVGGGGERDADDGFGGAEGVFVSPKRDDALGTAQEFAGVVKCHRRKNRTRANERNRKTVANEYGGGGRHSGRWSVVSGQWSVKITN